MGGISSPGFQLGRGREEEKSPVLGLSLFFPRWEQMAAR